MPRRYRIVFLAALCGSVGATALRAQAPPAPWTASPADSDSAVADWAASKFATPPAERTAPASEPRKLAVSSEAVIPTPSNAVGIKPPTVGDRYASAAPVSSPPTRPQGTPLAVGNPLRGAGGSPIQLRSGIEPSRSSAARNAFAPSPEEFSSTPATRIAVGAEPLQATTPAPERSVAIADEAFRPAPTATPPQRHEAAAAWNPEPTEPLRVASIPEPAPFASPIPASNVVPSDSPSEGVGRPGPAKLEGPQEASLVVEKRGPREVRIGQACRFIVKVRNTGTSPAGNVVLTDQVPAGSQLISTNPTADSRDGRLVWRLGKLGPGEERQVEVRLEPVREGPLGSVATVTMDASASAATTCTRPALAIQMAAAERVRLGQEQTISIDLHNPGTGAATNVLLVEEVPPELRHAAGADLEYVVGTLEPGETRHIELQMTAERAGHVVNAVSVVADGDLRAERSVEFEVIAPSLAVSIDGPKRRYLERPASYTISVDNPGTATAKDVRVVTHLPRGMEFVKANNLGEYDATTHSVYWSLAELPEGERGEVRVVAMPVTAGEHTLRAESESADGLTAKHDHAIRVEGVASLAFEVRDLQDPIEVGEETAYEIRVLNEGTKSATGVRVLVEAPGGMRVVAAQGQTAGRVAAGRAEFAPLPQLAPGEKAAYRVRVTGVEPGDQRITVLVTSDDLTRPIRREESTRVFGDE